MEWPSLELAEVMMENGNKRSNILGGLFRRAHYLPIVRIAESDTDRLVEPEN